MVHELKVAPRLAFEDQMMSLREVAEAARISRATLGRLIKEGRGPRVRALSERRRGVTGADYRTWIGDLAI
jgi:predicted DNA-binding transcriptional regulator AlpA